MKDWFPFPPLYPTDTQPSPAVAALGCALCGKGQNKALAILIRRAKMNPLERWSDLTEYRAHIHDATQSKDHVFSHCKCHFFPKVQVCLIIDRIRKGNLIPEGMAQFSSKFCKVSNFKKYQQLWHKKAPSIATWISLIKLQGYQLQL